MRSNRRNHTYWPLLLIGVVVLVAPATARADGDTPTSGDEIAVPDTEPPATTSSTIEPKPETPTSTTEPAPPPSTSELEVSSTEPPTADAEVPPPPPTTLPAEPDAAATTQAPAPEAPTTTLPPAQSVGPTTVPDAEPAVVQTTQSPNSVVSTTVASVAPEIAPAPLVTTTPEDPVLAAFEALPNGIIRQISFPVLGPVKFFDDWGQCRDECTRYHEGTDLLGVRMQPLLAAVDGTVTRITYANIGTSGVGITVTGEDGWYYNYFHVNDDTPGTDDGAAGNEWEVPPMITVGSRVRAGQVIAYMGDSGNAEVSVPHLHFEIRQPDRTPVNPYPSLVAASERQTCSGYDSGLALSEEASLLSPTVAISSIDRRGRWLIDATGQVSAEGSAALITRIAGLRCPPTSG